MFYYFITFIGAIVMAIGGLAASIGEDGWKSFGKVKYRILIAIGGIIVAVGVFGSSYEQGKYEEEMRKKSEATIFQVQETLNTLTGGDSYPFVSFLINQNTNTAFPVLSHSGSYPLYDVVVRIVDDKKWSDGSAGATLDEPAKDSTFLSVHSLIPNTTFFPKDISIPLSTSEDIMNFNIWIGARNEWFSQKIQLKKSDQKWLRSLQVFRDQRPSENIPLSSPTVPEIVVPNAVSNDDAPVPKELLHEWKDPDFPS